MNRIRRALNLSAPERTAVFRAFSLLWAVRVGLSTMPFRAVRQRCSQAVATARPDALQALTPQRIVRLVAVASRLVPGAHCLPRALVGQLLLAQGGYRSDLRIGVRKEGRLLDAHAWLEIGGIPLLEDEDHVTAFTPLTPPAIRHLQRK